MAVLLTDYEMQLVTDREILLAKNRIIQRVVDLFGEVSDQYQKVLQNKMLLSEELANAKISRGEHYLGLPYVMLDYPRQFSKENIFAIRSFFWWGNFFSITLHLSGTYLQRHFLPIEKAIAEKRFNGWFIAVSQNPWRHDFEKDNYLMIDEGNNYNLGEKPYLKLSSKIPLTRWEDARLFFIKNFSALAAIIESYAPMR